MIIGVFFKQVVVPVKNKGKVIVLKCFKYWSQRT